MKRLVKGRIFKTMASTNHTEHLNLNQWVGTDPVLMADFNADNAKIDAAVGALQSSALRSASGSYAGAGGSGSEHPNTLTFPFPPKLVIILGGGYTSFFLGGCAEGVGWSNRGSIANLQHTASWNGSSLSWYIDTAWTGDGSWIANEHHQQNGSGVVYRWFAIG